MNRLYTYLIIVFAATMFITSCSKTYIKSNNVAPVAADQSGLNSLFGSLRPAPQSLAVTAGSLQKVYGFNGTKLTFYPNSFKDKNGKIITSGTINIQLTEVYTIADMIASRAPTVSDGRLLTSGGAVVIKATMNGEEVFANKYGIGFKQSAQSQQPMSLFYGNTNTPDSAVAWAILGAPGVGVSVLGTVSNIDTAILYIVNGSGGYDTVIKTSAVLNYYQFDSCADFNWINCDYFYTASAKLTDVTVYVPDSSYNLSNTEVFILFPGINAAAHMNQYAVGSHAFDLSQGYYLTVGMQVDIVVATNKNGTYYYYQQTGITTINGLFIFANMSQTTLSYIETQLQGL